jgi:hypothetical protein
MNLEQLTNYELWLRFNKLDHKNYLLKDREVLDAYIDLPLILGVQDDAKHSRQTIIDFIREQEALQQHKSRRRMEGGRKRKSRRSKSRRNKSRKSRRSKK